MEQPDQLRPYDAFISYSHLDRDWVYNALIPSLAAAGVRYLIDDDFKVGRTIDQNISEAIEHSRHTLAVVSPSWAASEWSQFELGLVGVADPAAAQRKVRPALIADCKLPARLAGLTFADFREPSSFEGEMKRIVHALLHENESVPAQPEAPAAPAPQPAEDSYVMLSRLAKLVVRSGRVAQNTSRVALCRQIGIDPANVITESIPADFAEQLAHSLYESGDTAALVRLCDRISPFLKGVLASELQQVRKSLGATYGTAHT